MFSPCACRISCLDPVLLDQDTTGHDIVMYADHAMTHGGVPLNKTYRMSVRTGSQGSHKIDS